MKCFFFSAFLFFVASASIFNCPLRCLIRMNVRVLTKVWITSEGKSGNFWLIIWVTDLITLLHLLIVLPWIPLKMSSNLCIMFWNSLEGAVNPPRESAKIQGQSISVRLEIWQVFSPNCGYLIRYLCARNPKTRI